MNSKANLNQDLRALSCLNHYSNAVSLLSSPKNVNLNVGIKLKDNLKY